jgi:hypothetical protein
MVKTFFTAESSCYSLYTLQLTASDGDGFNVSIPRPAAFQGVERLSAL